MKRIIIHWTAGAWFPNATDKEHYHFLIDKNGKIINGKSMSFVPESLQFKRVLDPLF